MISNKTISRVILVLILLIIAAYILVTAPPPLPEADESAGKKVSVQKLFNIVAYENSTVRTLYTKCIVGEGKKQGLVFNEQWKEKDVQSGPLPALFLRETASQLKVNNIPLNLFLGSDFPVAEINRFSGIQKEYFDAIRKTGKPQFFYDSEQKYYTAMFPDYASDAGCVNCHNQHKKSTKTDWKQGDIMGATTWSYPSDSVTIEEVIRIVNAFRKSSMEVYAMYLQEASALSKAPVIGKKWPSQGYFLPASEVFADSVSVKTSNQTLQTLLELN
jgi:adenylate cyclase